MDRLACVELPALPLQLLLRRHPTWGEGPVAVVDRDSPTGLVLHVNRVARQQRVRAGMRYAAALSVARDLRADAVPNDELRDGVALVLATLQDFSPRVEPAPSGAVTADVTPRRTGRRAPRSPAKPATKGAATTSAKATSPTDGVPGGAGLFFVDASGLSHLHESLLEWATRVRAALAALRLHARVAVGFTRFGVLAAARSIRDMIVFDDPEAERGHAERVPLETAGVAPRLRDTLEQLGVRTVGAFLRLPAAGVRDRLGEEAYALHRTASDAVFAPLQAAPLLEPIVERVRFDLPVDDGQGLLFLASGMIGEVLERLARRTQAARALRVELRTERGTTVEVPIVPAAPTRDRAALQNLLVLRFERLTQEGTLDGGVEELAVHADAAPLDREQARLFLENARRDLKSAARALARVRAAFGADVVARAVLRDGHLPEGRFRLEPVSGLAFPQAHDVLQPPLVRRLLTRAVELGDPPRHARDFGWLPLGAERGPVVRMEGPFLVSGGWWRREVHREYHLAELQGGDLLWLYRDRDRRRYLLCGLVQ